MNNRETVLLLITVMVVLFCGQAFIEGTNMRTIVETCKEAK